ncbi:MAG: mannonate dehydratase [Planctomycetaceae bacterium]|jgi:mannonate dehydratase|nr:mannonate dehydratase [Planctomycetaceae bacterium]
MFLPFEPDRRWKIAQQAGVTCAVVKLAPELTRREPPSNLETLREAKQRFNNAGFELFGLEGDQFDMTRIKLGLEGRDHDIETYRNMLRNMGELGIPFLCYNFMVGVGWFRNRTTIHERGGAFTCGFELDEILKKEDCERKIESNSVWEHYQYFLERILPVAEKSGVRLGLHPDDPPIPSLKGYGRIFYNANGVRKALNLSSSRSHGLTFCQANYLAMGENVTALIREWKDRIGFVHFRDIKGTANSFVETFHDNGPHDMAELIRVYRENGLHCPVRTDHAPSMDGEGEATGYEILGHLFALGYLKGLLDYDQKNVPK